MPAKSISGDLFRFAIQLDPTSKRSVLKLEANLILRPILTTPINTSHLINKLQSQTKLTGAGHSTALSFVNAIFE